MSLATHASPTPLHPTPITPVSPPYTTPFHRLTLLVVRGRSSQQREGRQLTYPGSRGYTCHLDRSSPVIIAPLQIDMEKVKHFSCLYTRDSLASQCRKSFEAIIQCFCNTVISQTSSLSVVQQEHQSTSTMLFVF